MVRVLVLATAIVSPVAAWACGGASACACKQHEVAAARTSPHAARTAALASDRTANTANPGHCAQDPELMGANCSYTTNMMAQRVLEEGQPYSFTGHLDESGNTLRSRVAAPYTVGPDSRIYVVANQIVEQLAATGDHEGRITLQGKILDVEGISYFVPTDFHRGNT